MNIEDLVHFLLPLYVEVWVILPLELWNLDWWRLSLWELIAPSTTIIAVSSSSSTMARVLRRGPPPSPLLPSTAAAGKCEPVPATIDAQRAASSLPENVTAAPAAQPANAPITIADHCEPEATTKSPQPCVFEPPCLSQKQICTTTP